VSATWGDRPAHRVPARKIHPPPPPTPHVVRERIGARPETEAVGSRPVTLVSAPTGYGKSTFLAAWARTSTTRVAWLGLDDLDNDPQTLWHGIVSSIEAADVRTTGRSGPWPLDDLWGPGHDDGGPVDRLISVIDDSTEPVVLVLDDVDEIRSDGARATLDRLLRYLPDQLRVVLAGRFDPPLALQRLRAHGDLTEFRAADLRFTRKDVQTLGELSGVTLTTDDQHELHEATSGWPVAVRMALVTARDTPVGPTLQRLLSPRSPVADLLVADLLASLRPDLARFVLRATTCRRIDAELADALSGSPDGSRLLVECVDRGLFLEREPEIPGTSAVYRWHDLFRAQCQARLAASEPSTWRSLHRTASHHWRDRDLEEAVDHALAGGRPALAAQCISEQWIELVLRGQHALLLSLCLRVPPPFDENPDLLLLVAVCRYLEGNPVQADLQVRRAHARAAADPPVTDGGRFVLLESLLRLLLAVDAPDLVEMARRGRELLSPGSATTDDTATAGAEYIVGQLLCRVGERATGVALLEASATIATSRRMTALRLACEAELALVASTVDGVGAGRTRARRVLDEAATLGWQSAATISPAVLALARAAFERDDLDEARTLAARSASRNQPTDHYLRVCSQALLLEVALAAGEPAGAEALHSSLLRREHDMFLPATWPVVALMLDARWSYAHGSSSDARQTAEKAAFDVMLPHHPGSLVWCADLLRLDGDLVGARAVLDLLPGGCRASHSLVAHRVVGALLADAEEQPDKAHRLLEQAIALAEVDDVRRPFVDRSCQVLPLLRAHLGWGSLHTAYTVTLLEHLPGVRPAAPLVQSFWSLTPREHEVLVYLRSAMTAADIAAAVFLSVNTVKTHQRAIYRKLGVVGRREAVEVAAERGLL